MEKFVQRICDKLHDNKIEVIKALFKKKDKKYYIMADKALLVTDESRIITVCFSVAAQPEYAAKIIIVLKTLRCNGLNIGETFIYNDKGEYFGGDEAYRFIEKIKKDKIISDFMSERFKKHKLLTEECYNC